MVPGLTPYVKRILNLTDVMMINTCMTNTSILSVLLTA